MSPRRSPREGGRAAGGPSGPTDPRRLALQALAEIDDGGFANIVVPALLGASGMSERDRAFTTTLVYGTTRMRRALDLLVDRFVLRELDGPTRNALRLGAHQLHHLGTPPHAAVSATVAVAPPRSRGLVNAVLRRIAEAPVTWPDDATRLSYPDWVVERLVEDLGRDDALAALEQMNEPAAATVRDDGYTQDLASQWVAGAAGAAAGELVADLCAAPGGKATLLASTGAHVLASDLAPARVALITENLARLAGGAGQGSVAVALADGTRPPWRPASLDRVLVDAPCSGLGVLRRRPDARWRATPDDVGRLVPLQRRLLAAAIGLLVPGGTLLYSVCTMTAAETREVDAWLAGEHPGLAALDHLGDPWRPHGRGDLLLPHDAGTDGMFCLRLRLPG
jgi:16S rRNA (cytosine967-C5)-methyltransferase